MPVRKIPKNYRNVTGVSACAKACGGGGFESTLERDYLTLLEFDQAVEQFEVQPLVINWQDTSGGSHTYTPDVLVLYKAELILKPLLVEIKYRSELRQDWYKLRPKFKAAIRECRARNWRFKIMTEVEIRTPFLSNAKFLLPFIRQSATPNPAIADTLAKLKICSVAELLQNITHDSWEQAATLPGIWSLMATGRIGCDLSEPLTMESRIWHVRG